MSRPRRTTAIGLSTTVAVMAAVVGAAAPANATTQYQWWAYWFANPGTSSWTYAPIGAGGHRVDDGGVEGWRFAVAVPNPSAPPPRTSAASAFQSICGHTDRPDGKDRVALVVDFGTAADAPHGEHPPTSSVRGTCVVVPDRSNGLQVLATAGYSIRQDGSGLVCALQGYPRTGCGVVVTPTTSTKPTPQPTAKPTSKASTRPTRTSSSVTPAPSSDAQPGRSGQAGTPSASRTAATSPGASSGPASASVSASSAAASGDTPSSTGVALEVGPPPDDPSGPSTGFVGLLVGALAVAALAGAGVLRGRNNRGRT